MIAVIVSTRCWVIPGFITNDRLATNAPVSTPSSIQCTLTPEDSSPCQKTDEA
jgi:hypothetical protein